MRPFMTALALTTLIAGPAVAAHSVERNAERKPQRGYFPGNPRLEPLSPSNSCEDLSVMVDLARADGLYARQLGMVEQMRRRVCNRGLDGRNLVWRNGRRARAGKNVWYYPNGETAKYGKRNWFYPSGQIAQSSKRTWYYPNGRPARLGKRRWFTPDGQRVSRDQLINSACRYCDSCPTDRSFGKGKSPAEQAAFIEFVWSSWNTNKPARYSPSRRHRKYRRYRRMLPPHMMRQHASAR